MCLPYLDPVWAGVKQIVTERIQCFFHAWRHRSRCLSRPIGASIRNTLSRPTIDEVSPIQVVFTQFQAYTKIERPAFSSFKVQPIVDRTHVEAGGKVGTKAIFPA